MTTTDGFLRVAAATPHIRVADVPGNATSIIEVVRTAVEAGVSVLVLPELCLTGYTCGDLFCDQTLLDACKYELASILSKTAELPILFAVGLPVAYAENIYNCAAVCQGGRVLGLSAKRHVPNYGEFYERRWFAPAPPDIHPIMFLDHPVPFGSGLVYPCPTDDGDEVHIGVEICEDLWVPNPPSTFMATSGGATVILNLSASDEVIGKADYRRQLVSGQSARLYCAYVYADAGAGESTTDLVFAGHNLVAENGTILASTKLFSCDMALSDVDIKRLLAERRRSTTWMAGPCPKPGLKPGPRPDFGLAPGPNPCYPHPADEDRGLADFRPAPDAPYAPHPPYPPQRPKPLHTRLATNTTRVFPRHPFVPENQADLSERCETILGLQTAGLATRLAHTGTKNVVIGLSGGLDSTLALLICIRAIDALKLPRAGVHAVSMPGFGTTGRTKSNAQRLAEELGVDFRELPINDAVKQHFALIEHDESVHDVTYENAQARERTQILMDLSNKLGGFVVGTGDLSELALGWATYNADHMSMYGVNASVPKTLVRHLVRYASTLLGDAAEKVLLDILDTPVSPELLPPTGDGQIAQRTEDLVGPYELHDYFLYYVLRFGLTPGRVYRQACRSFEGVFESKTILMWLRVFYQRFFAQQFKRSCLPDGPKVGSVTLSPRGDWRMPSDASVKLWLQEIDSLDEF